MLALMMDYNLVKNVYSKYTYLLYLNIFNSKISRFIIHDINISHSSMYKHNPLPFDISKHKYKHRARKRNIVFSSPKITQLADRAHSRSQQKANQAKSESKQKSMHRIDSKQKPRILTPHRQNKSFEQSTAEYPNSFNISPVKTNHQNMTPSYFNVTSLLKNQPTRDSSLKESMKKSFAKEKHPQIMRIHNKSSINSSSEAMRKLNLRQNIQRFDIGLMIAENAWKSYEGETQNGKFQGYGVMYFVNGDKYLGFFHHNLPSNHGTYYENGSEQVTNGIWQKGKLIQNF